MIRRREALLGFFSAGVVAAAPEIGFLVPEPALAHPHESGHHPHWRGPNFAKRAGLTMFMCDDMTTLHNAQGVGQDLFYEDGIVVAGMVSHRRDSGRMEIIYYDDRMKVLDSKGHNAKGYHAWKTNRASAKNLGGSGDYRVGFWYGGKEYAAFDFTIK